jgi:hypothetical protein
MAWPFSNVVAPNFDSGPGSAVPTPTPAAVTTGPMWLLGAVFTNTANAQRTVTLTDTAGLIVSEIVVPGLGELPCEWPFRPVTGLKWSADGAGIVGQVWGYQ